METTFSVLKRRFGEHLKPRNYRYQIRMIKVMILVCNLKQSIKKWVVSASSKLFYGAE